MFILDLSEAPGQAANVFKGMSCLHWDRVQEKKRQEREKEKKTLKRLSEISGKTGCC